METEIIVIAVVVIIAAVVAGVAIILKRKPDIQMHEIITSLFGTKKSTLALRSKKSAWLTRAANRSQDFAVQMEMLPAATFTDEHRLVEITDSKVLARVTGLVPGLAQAGNAAANAVRGAKASKEVLYRAILPAGEKLAKSRTTEGAVRGFFHGSNGVKGHADFVKVNLGQGGAVAANVASSAMAVGAMVVGQYYMTQINSELGAISEGISRISRFQNDEYRSRVFSLVALVKGIADFQIEILEHNELRFSKLTQLDRTEEECSQLLGQANLALVGYTKKTDLDYSEYEKELQEEQSWYMYQKILIEILGRISELRYTLHLGTVSREQCISLLDTYRKQVEDTQRRLSEWHRKTTQRLKIDTSGVRRRRAGFDGVIHYLPGLINDDLNFRAIEKRTAQIIRTQIEGDYDTCGTDSSDLYAEDVQLISKNGKIYYLPPTY